ncbi:MAG: hypothetical protein PUC29_03895, partial [Clostridia bacterium]|nr:hypothetical protein [Clostridia bacterium]
EVSVDYYTLCEAAEFSGMNGTFDSHLAEMTAHWDSIIRDEFSFTSFSDEVSYKEYCRSIIKDKINGDGAVNVCFAAARKLLSGESEQAAELTAEAAKTAEQTLSRITELSGGTYLILTEGVPVLEDNLDALVTLKSYSYICRKTGNEKGAAQANEALSRLLSSVESAMEKTADSLSCHWTAATTKGSADNLLFSLNAEGFSSAKAMCRWYVCGSIFNGDVSSALNHMAEEAFNRADGTIADCLAASVVSETESGGVFIGRGLSASQLYDGAEISFENYKLSDGNTVGAKISVSGNEITVTLNFQKPAAVSVGLPVCRGNIEYASCGFDYSTGIVTAPAGMSVITVRLVTDTETVINENKADCVLESAIFRASEKSAEGCTTVSSEIFDEAYDNALSARVGTAEVKTTAAQDLDDAVGKLSKMTAEYSFSLSDGERAGELSRDMIMQKFTVSSEGVLDRVFLGGEYKDGVFAAVYTLRRDGYTTDRMIGETDGERCDGGILFDFEAEVEKDTEYVLCVFNERSDVRLRVLLSDIDDTGLYVRESGADKVYRASCLDAEFTVIQADRTELDTFYNKCVDTDTKGYTKESVKNLNSAMKEAKEVLCTPSVTKEKAKTVFENLKGAFSRLETYASDDKNVDSPVMLAVLIGASVAVLAIVATTVIVANVRRNKKDKELLK